MATKHKHKVNHHQTTTHGSQHTTMAHRAQTTTPQPKETFNTAIDTTLPSDTLRSAGITDTDLEMVWASRGYVNPNVMNAANYYGLNFMRTGQTLASPRLGYGYVFFTRPRLCLTHDNLTRSRRLMKLATKDKNSIWNIIRAYLDPVGQRNGNIVCDLVNPDNPFISILSNNCMDMSGWPEVTVNPYTSREGLAGEQYSLADGFSHIYSAYNLSGSFRNVRNSFITELFDIWTHYMLLNHNGRVVSYLDDVIYNRISYNTRIYRFLVDQASQHIQDCACTGAAFPVNSGKASMYDYRSMEGNGNDIYNHSVDEVSIQFQCNGAEMGDPIIMREFNKTVEMFNPSFRLGSKNTEYVAIPPDLMKLFNYTAIPYIDLRTGRFHWYVRKAYFDYRLKNLGVK